MKMNISINKMSLQKKLVLIILPFIIIILSLSLILSIISIEKVLKKNISEQMSLMSSSVTYEIESEVSKIIGIMENARTSINRTCTNYASLQNYLYNISDAYAELIPTGMYCGLTDGRYIDKMWTPEPGWNHKDRPWYKSGLNSDNISFSDMYIDSNTGKYCITASVSINDSSNNVIGVIAADVFLDSIVSTLSSKKIFDNGYVYAVDKSSELVIGNKHNEKENGKKISELKGDINKYIYKQIKKENYNKTLYYKDVYFSLNKLSNSNFIIICRDSKKDVEKNLTSIKSIIYLTSVFSLLFICIIVFIVIGILLKPVSKLNSFIGNLSNLDLSSHANINTKDELGTIANLMNDFVNKLQSIIIKIKNAIIEFDKKADDNASVSSNLNKLSNEQSQSLTKLLTTLDSVSASIHTIAMGTSKLTSSIIDTSNATIVVDNKVTETLSYVNIGKDDMNKMTSTMNEISDISSDLQTAVNNVHNELKDINSMVKVINDISDQTSLLSLNASIEAARAGELGKGFAVVAEEIRVLAENCSDSVTQIASITSKIEHLFNVVITKTSDSINKIKDGNIVVNTTNDTFYKINDIINEINDATSIVRNSISEIQYVTTDIVSNIEEQNTNAQSISNDCHEVLEIVNSFTMEGSNIDSSANELKDLSSELAKLIDVFKVQ